MRTWEPEEAPQVGFSRQGAPSKGRTPGRAGQDHPSKEKVLGTFGESSTSIPMVETGQEPAAAREAPNSSTRAMDDTDGGGEVSQRDTDDVESISDGEARETRHRSSPSDPTPPRDSRPRADRTCQFPVMVRCLCEGTRSSRETSWWWPQRR